MAVICPLCGFENPDGTKICRDCGESIKEATYGTYNRPLTLIKDITGKLVDGKIPFSQDRLDGLHVHISELLQDVMDNCSREIQENFRKLRDEVEDLSEVDEKLFNSFKSFMGEFEEAQMDVNNGISLLKDSLFSTKNLTDLEEKSPAFIAAEELIQHGLTRLETVAIQPGRSLN